MVKYTTRSSTTMTPTAASSKPVGLRLTLVPPLARMCLPELALLDFIVNTPSFYGESADDPGHPLRIISRMLLTYHKSAKNSSNKSLQWVTRGKISNKRFSFPSSF